MNNQVLVSQVEAVGAEIGEPDCKLIEPFLLDKNDLTLSPWLIDFTTTNEYKIHSDKILAMADPKPTILEKYQNLIK
jgi:hypothetical protein